MNEQTTILLAYAIFIWLVVLHTFEEIAEGIFDLQLGHIQMEKWLSSRGFLLSYSENIITDCLMRISFALKPRTDSLKLYSSSQPANAMRSFARLVVVQRLALRRDSLCNVKDVG